MKSVNDLQLFPRLTRAKYREQYGQEPPKWQTERRIQRWFDPNPPADGAYIYFNPATGYFEPMAVPPAEAKTPNLPGAYSYPKWSPAPTAAVLQNMLTRETFPVNPRMLSEFEEAAGLAAELGLGQSHVRENRFGGPFFGYVWNGETRRLWVIDFPRGSETIALQVGLQLEKRHANGVGAPGHWDKSGAEPVWIPEAGGDVGEYDPRPEIPIPCRPLGPGEKLRRIETPFGVNWYVVGIGDMTDRELLEATHAAVVEMVRLIGVVEGVK